MEQPPLPQLPPVSVSFEGGVLRATDFGDLYYSAEDGLAESRHVFLEGTALPASLSEARHLTIAETGFGTGLNLLALCQVIAAQNSQCQIDYISFEAAPLDAKDAMRAHQAFPELAELSQSLIGQWPRRWHGVHR
ncbi:MAG: tRNA (5-methylaminomethyl-2-thiouridine)(34)-methyltransferase MnmD, partial [Candidatus Puniceispirillaceae bacterium]